MDLAASIQAVTEEVDAAMGRELHPRDRDEEAGAGRRRGAQLRRQRRLLREGPFENIWIQPAAGDAGGALGAALFSWHQLLEKPRPPARTDRQKGSFLGRRILDRRTSCRFLDKARRQVPTRRQRDRARSTRSSDLLVDEKDRRLVPGADGIRPACAWRAQHHRRPAVAEDAGDDESEDQVPRELPAVRTDACSATRRTHWFEHRSGPGKSLHAAGRAGPRDASRPDHRRSARDRWRAIPICGHRVNIPRSDIPAVTHVDYSARLQTIDADRNPRIDQAAAGVPAAHRMSRCWSTPASTSAASRSSARRRTRTAASSAPRWTCSCSRMCVLLKEDVAQKLDASAREIPRAIPVGLVPSEVRVQVEVGRPKPEEESTDAVE